MLELYEVQLVENAVEELHCNQQRGGINYDASNEDSERIATEGHVDNTLSSNFFNT